MNSASKPAEVYIFDSNVTFSTLAVKLKIKKGKQFWIFHSKSIKRKQADRLCSVKKKSATLKNI